MTNEEFLKWENLVYKIARRYQNVNRLYDIDDLVSVGSIGLMKGLESYNIKTEIPEVNWLANNISWAIHREINKRKRIDNFINIPLETEIGENLTVEDFLQDMKVDIENQVIDRIILEEYCHEFEKYLNDREREILYMKVFNNLSYRAIAERLNLSISTVSELFVRAKRKLLHRSYYIKSRYLEYVGSKIDYYNNPVYVVMDREKLDI